MSVERNLIETMDYNIVHGFRPETENFHFAKKGYRRKGHVKSSSVA